MKLVSFPVVSAFAASAFQPSIPRVKMQKHQRFACKSLKFKHTAYARWLALSVPFINTHAHAHTQSSANPTSPKNSATWFLFKMHCRAILQTSPWQRCKFKHYIPVRTAKQLTVWNSTTPNTYTDKSVFNGFLFNCKLPIWSVFLKIFNNLRNKNKKNWGDKILQVINWKSYFVFLWLNIIQSDEHIIKLNYCYLHNMLLFSS